MVHPPALRLKQGRKPTIPIASILPCEEDNRFRQCFLIATGMDLIPLGGSWLPQHLTRVSFGHAQSLTDCHDRATSSGGA